MDSHTHYDGPYTVGTKTPLTTTSCSASSGSSFVVSSRSGPHRLFDTDGP